MLKRKSTVHFKEEPRATKKERRIGVVKRERSKSPGRKVSTFGSRDLMASRNENIDSKREHSRQSATENKQSATGKNGKVELPKKRSIPRKISTFALLHEPEVKPTLQSKNTDINENEVEKGEESDPESNKISMDGRGDNNKESDKESNKISLNNREENKESDRDSNKISVDDRGEKEKESNIISPDISGENNRESDKESNKISPESKEESDRESGTDFNKISLNSKEEIKISDKESDKLSLDSRREKHKDSDKMSGSSREEENKESDKISNKISLDSRVEKNKESEIDSNKISLNSRGEKDMVSDKESNDHLVDHSAQKEGQSDREFNKSPLDNNKESNKISELSKTPGQISTDSENVLTKETSSPTTEEAQGKSRNGAVDKQLIKEHEGDTTTRIPQLVGTPKVKNGTGSSSSAAQPELFYNETSHDAESFKAKRFTLDTKDTNGNKVSHSTAITNNNVAAENENVTRNGAHSSDAKISGNLNNSGDGSISLEEENTNVPHQKEMKPGAKETTVADPKDIEEITAPHGAETEVMTKPSERGKLRISFSKESLAPQTNGEPEPKHASKQDQVSSEDKINGLKPKKKEVSFVETAKEQEKIHPKQSISSKREEVTSKSAAPTRDSVPSRNVPAKNNTTPAKRDTPPRRDATPPRKINKVAKPSIQTASKKESVATDKNAKLIPKSINNEVVPKKISDTSKHLYAPAKKKASTAKEPATYYINKDNPSVIIKKKTPPKAKPITPQMSSKSVVEVDKPKRKISPAAVKPKQPTRDREDVDSLDLSDSDDEDIFAKAMRKYGITISDDDDD